MDALPDHIYLKILFVGVSLLGIVPNATIIFLYFKLHTNEMSSYSAFLLTFAVTELLCSISTLLTMNRLHIVSIEEYWFMPLGPCNQFCSFVCEVTTALQTGCLINITTLIPLSFAYRFYVVTNGTPRLRNICVAVMISVVPPIASVPLLSTAVIHDDDKNLTISRHYHIFKFDKYNPKTIIAGWYLSIGLLLFPANFILGALIMHRIKKFSNFLTAKTVRLHRLLTKALFCHTIIHFIIVLTTGLYCLIALKIIKFSYSDVLPSIIYSLIPFLNGSVCLFYVPHYRRVLKDWLSLTSKTNQRIFLQNSEGSQRH